MPKFQPNYGSSCSTYLSEKITKNKNNTSIFGNIMLFNSSPIYYLNTRLNKRQHIFLNSKNNMSRYQFKYIVIR